MCVCVCVCVWCVCGVCVRESVCKLPGFPIRTSPSGMNRIPPSLNILATAAASPPLIPSAID